MRQIRFFTILLSLLFYVTACAPTVPEPTATLVELPTTAPSATPSPEPTATPGIIPETIASDPAKQAYLRIIHAAPESLAVNVNVEDLTIIRNLRFQTESGLLDIAAGDYNLRVFRQDPAPDENPLLAETRISIQGGQTVFIVFSGLGDNLTVTAFPENQDSLNAGESRVTFIHAVPGGGTITAQRNGFPVGSAVNFGQVAAPVIVPSADVTLDFVAGATPLTSYRINLRERYNYTLFLVGEANDPESFSVLEFENRAPGRVDIRAVNVATPIDSRLDFYLNATPLATGLAYGQAAPRQAITDEVYTLTVYNAGADTASSTPLITSQISANAGDTITLITFGSLENLQALTYRENLSPTPPGQFRVAFLNPLENVPVARVATSGGQLPGVPDIGFGQTPFQVTLPASSYSLFWNKMENNEAVEAVEIAENLVFEAGRNYLYIVTGRFDNLPLILSDSVGIDETMVDFSANVTPSPTPEIPTQIRFVNAIANGTVISYRVNGRVAIPEISFGLGSELTSIPAGNYTIEVTLPGSDTAVISSDAFFDIASRYTLVAYGPSIEEGRLLVVPDFNLVFGETSPHIRLFNLSPSIDTRFTLAYGVPTETARPGDLEQFGEGVFRQSFAFGIQLLETVEVTEAGSFSNVSLIPAGTHDIYVIDSNTNEIAVNIQNVTISEGTHYDVLAFQNRDSPRVRAFILAYPSFSR
jgi:hypothetical protein